jgi:GDSL-like Lipase/Acylhydrolase family
MSATAEIQPARLPRRDYLLLPLVSLLTIFLMFGTAEVISRWIFEEQFNDICAYNAGDVGWLFKPNCTVSMKGAEGKWVVNHYNNCGYRTEEACGPKPVGGRRVALMGYSISRGYFVSYEDSFAARSSDILARLCGGPVDFQNLGMNRGGRMDLRVDEALALRPDAIVIVIAPFDVSDSIVDQEARSPGPMRSASSAATISIGAVAREAGKWSRAVAALRHAAFTDVRNYLPLYLKMGDEADYLRPPFSQPWLHRISVVERLLGHIAANSAPAGVPVVLVFLPSRAQAALTKVTGQFSGVDPYAFGRTLGEVAGRHGVQYLDLTDALSREQNPAGHFFPVDTHPNEAGHALIAAAVVNHLITYTDSFVTCQTTSPNMARELPNDEYRHLPR